MAYGRTWAQLGGNGMGLLPALLISGCWYPISVQSLFPSHPTTNRNCGKRGGSGGGGGIGACGRDGDFILLGFVGRFGARDCEVLAGLLVFLIDHSPRGSVLADLCRGFLKII